MGHHTIINYKGKDSSGNKIDFGRVYLGDLGKRHGLGGAVEGVSTLGQDRYISWGQDATFMQTGNVLMSAADSTVSGKSADGSTFYKYHAGVIRNFVNKGAFTVTFDA